MSFRYLKIFLIALALVFISQGCFPPPPPFHHRHHRHWHGASQQQLHAAVQLANQGGGDFNYTGEVAK
jgi:hypothetical protein